MRGRSWRLPLLFCGGSVTAFAAAIQIAAAPTLLLGERIFPLGLAPVVHRLAEHVDEHENPAAAFLQRAADGFEQIDDSWKHGKRPLVLASVVGVVRATRVRYAAFTTDR